MPLENGGFALFAFALYSHPVANPSPRFSRTENNLIIRFLQAIDVCYARIYHQLVVHSPCPLPRGGAAILVCNHTSGLDPLLIQSVCPRMIRWMMSREYYEMPALKWVFKTTGAIPVERGGRDLSATRSAMRALADGYVVGIFPEGRIETSRDLMPFQTGATMMAIKTGVPVYPAYLDGTQRNKPMRDVFTYPQKASLRFGQAIDLDRQSTDQAILETATAEIRATVEEMRDRIIG